MTEKKSNQHFCWYEYAKLLLNNQSLLAEKATCLKAQRNRREIFVAEKFENQEKIPKSSSEQYKLNHKSPFFFLSQVSWKDFRFT